MIDHLKNTGTFNGFFSDKFIELQDNISEILFLFSVI